MNLSRESNTAAPQAALNLPVLTRCSFEGEHSEHGKARDPSGYAKELSELSTADCKIHTLRHYSHNIPGGIIS